MTQPTAALAESTCPYDRCGHRRAFDPRRRICKQCGGWLNFCTNASCRIPNRIFARFCRNCRSVLEPWESWPCLAGEPGGRGLLKIQSPWKDLHGMRLLSPWSRAKPVLGSEVSPPNLVAAHGVLMAFSAEGNLCMLDLRDGREIDRTGVSEDPLALCVVGEKLAALSTEHFRLFSLLGRGTEDYSATCATGFKRLMERPVTSGYRSYAGQVVPFGAHVVVAAVGPMAFGLSCLDLTGRQDLWEHDQQKTFPGELAFVVPWGEAGLIVGNREGRVVGLTGIKGTEAFQLSLPGGLSESFRRAVVDGNLLFYFNAAGDLCQLELSGRRSAQPIGEVHIERPSMLGIGPKEIVVGDRHGAMMRFNRFGLDRHDYTVGARTDELHGGFSLPVLTEDGQLLAATDSATLVFFGPRSSAPPREWNMSFGGDAHLRSYLLIGSMVVGVNTAGEVQAVKILATEEAPTTS